MQGLSRPKRAILIAGVAGLAAFGAWSLTQQLAPQGGAQGRPIAQQLAQLARDLDAADARGDRAAAANLGDPLSAALRQLNAMPDLSGPLQQCQIAAVHLVDGMGQVYEGRRWHNRASFEAALSACH